MTMKYSRYTHDVFNKTTIKSLTLENQLNFKNYQFEIDEQTNNKKIAILLLLANKGGNNIWAKVPSDIVRLIAKEVIEPGDLMYLPLEINGKKYRIRLEPVA